MQMQRTWKPVLAAILVSAFVPKPTDSSQAAGCFAVESIAGWSAGDLDLDTPGASRPLPPAQPGDFELCSVAAEGFAPKEDHYRYLVRRANGDFVFKETVLSIDSAGMAGLAARWDERTPTAAHVRIAVHTTRAGLELRSGLRLDNGGVELVDPTPVPVSLPVQLRIQRAGSTFTTSWSNDGVTFTPHLVADAAGHDLNHALLVVGAVQASEVASVHTAVFGDVGFVVPPVPRPFAESCVDDFAIPTSGGHEIELRGQNLQSVTGVTLAGIDGEIVSQGPRTLVVRAAPLPGAAASARPMPAPRNGDLVVQSAHGPQALQTRVVYAGVPFVRGDVNGDGRVGRADLRRLRLALADKASVSCVEAADVNADRRIDAADAKYLRDYLLGRGAPPGAPFPEAGFAPQGGRACGLPDAPVLSSVRRERDAGEHVLVRFGARRPRIREGDVLIVEGKGLPADPGRLAVRFGNVRTQVLPGSSAKALRVLVQTVPDGGAKCPLVLTDTAEAVAPLGTKTARSRFGVAYGVLDDPRKHPRVCPVFLPSQVAAVNVAQLREDGRSLLLPIDRATWDPTRPMEIDVSLPLPVVNGISRGAREISFTYFDPVTTRSYDAWIARLAARVSRELQGGRSAEGCECDAQALPAGGGIVIAPCDPVFGWEDNGTCCYPPPGPDVQLKAPSPPLWGATAFIPVPSDCEGDTTTNPRLRVWCEFEKVLRTNQATGLPQWESYDPLTNVLQGPQGIIDLKHPNDRTISEKSVMFSPNVFNEAMEHGYLIPCRAAARAYYCVGGLSDAMPSFTPAQRVIKTFWLRDEKLPPSLDPDELYNYVDPDGVRQNLVGMHFSIAEAAFAKYWTWSTFFAPRLVGEQHAKDGTALSWNDACTVGHIADRPVEIQGVWQSYFMCTQDAPGESQCGNPWGPPNECKQLSCAGCHVPVGTVNLPDKPSSLPELWMAWLPTFTDGEIAACFDDIKEANEQGVELYKSLAPEECQ